MNHQPTPSRPRLGLLIDAENSHASHLPQVMEHVHAYGRPTVLRAYGNWMNSQLAAWRKPMQQHGIQPRQVLQHMKGKNAADIAMVMDMMDLLHQRAVDGLCIMSSDGDFSGPAMRMREADLRIYGFGRRETVHTFVAACDVFVYLDAIGEAERMSKQRTLVRHEVSSGACLVCAPRLPHDPPPERP